MALRGADGLRAFCEDLASPEPSPGGGTASAAAGAMAASLLSMVCGITLKNKRHEADWPRLSELRDRAEELRSRLLRQAELDAAAYQEVVLRSREKRMSPGDAPAADACEMAVQEATRVPMSTAEACIQALRLSLEVAKVGTKSASSDIEVATRLAEAGVDGAVANILVNVPYSEDEAFRALARERADQLSHEKKALVAR